jgi:hypothetical protein
LSSTDAPTGVRGTRTEAIAPWAAGLLLAAPVLVAYYPPMTDLPLHEAAIGLLRHFGNPTMVPRGLYALNLGEPNQLFHMLGWALSYVMSTRWAVKLLVAASVVALPVAAARLARHVGSSPIAALVVAPMALGWLFSWGLVANLIGLSTLLAVLPVLDRLEETPTPRLALKVLGATGLLYIAHEAMMFLFAAIALGLAIVRPWSWRKLGWRLSPLVSGLVIGVAQARWQMRFMSPTVSAMPRMWRPVLEKLGEIPYVLLPATDRAPQLAMLALYILAIGAFFWLRAGERKTTGLASSGIRGLADARAWALRYRWELIAGAGFLAFLTFPVSLNGATLVHQRWFPPAIAIVAVVAAPRDLWVRRARVARIVAFVLPLATLATAWPAFADSDRAYREFDELLPHIEPGSAVASVDLEVDPTRSYSLRPAAGRVLATRGGRLYYAFTDSPVSPIVLRRRYQWNESLLRIGRDAWSFMPAHDLKRYRYVLVRTQDPMITEAAAYSLSAEANLVARSGEWSLFESKLPLVSLTSPDAPLEDPTPQTIRQRIEKLLDDLRNQRERVP